MKMFDDFYLNIKRINSKAIIPNQSGDTGNAGFDIYSVEDMKENKS